jgi:hypothetical protein
MKTDDDDNKLIGFIFCLLTFAIGLAIGLTINVNKVEKKTEEVKTEIVFAYTTAYNTLAYQTDNTPCIGADGTNICGRTDVVACPRNIKLGTWVKIDGKLYQCTDRTNLKYDGRFDISFDKDLKGALAYGIQLKEITIVQ